MICAVDPKRTHKDSVILWCGRGDPVWSHRRCSGIYTHPCGCTVPCSCPGHRDHHAMLADLEDHVVPNYLDAPFQRPGEQETIPTLVSAPSDEGPKHATALLDRMTLEQAAEVYAEAGARLLAAYDADPEEPFHVLRTVRRGIARGRDVDALLCGHLLATRPYGEQIVEGIGPVRVRRTQAAVHWDERGTAYAFIDQKMEEVGGEAVDPHTVVDWLLEAAAVDYYRKKALTAAGLDPQDFYTSAKGNPAVDLPPG